jgi:hypothetical protein
MAKYILHNQVLVVKYESEYSRKNLNNWMYPMDSFLAKKRFLFLVKQ